jgi:transcription-repair coupling factor (superfamily II helicase)
MAVLWRLAQPPLAAGRLVVTTIDALLQRLPPWRLWADAILRIEVAQALPLESLRTRLIRLGYRVLLLKGT